jgi:cytochrome c oxidase subunit 2
MAALGVLDRLNRLWPGLFAAVLTSIASPGCFGQERAPTAYPGSVFAPTSTPADRIYGLEIFVLIVTAVIFVVVFSLLVYSAVKYRRKGGDDGREPAQIYGSDQIELAWTVIPVIIVLVLFITSARVIHEIQDAEAPPNAVQVTVIGHQFWWEFRYPKYGIITANELHVPLSDPAHPQPTYLKLLSADTDHSFWVPRLAGKTDLIPNHPNQMWIDPHEEGLYLGQCAQYCGVQHAKMLLRVYVDSADKFAQWVENEKRRVESEPADETAAAGRRVFERTACIACHRVSGTRATGRVGPDLTHLMSRATLASGAAENTPANLRQWIEKPDSIKPRSLMPAMNLSGKELDGITAYMLTLK